MIATAGGTGNQAPADALQTLLSLDRIGELLTFISRWNGKDVSDLMPTAMSYAEIVGQFCLDAAPFRPTRRQRTPLNPDHPNGIYSHGCWHDLLGAENQLFEAAWQPFRQMAMRNGHPGWATGKLLESFWTGGQSGKSNEPLFNSWWWIAVDEKARALYVNDGTVVRALVNGQHAALERLIAQDGQPITVVGTILSVPAVSKERRQTEFILGSSSYTKGAKTNDFPRRVVVLGAAQSTTATLAQGAFVKITGRYKLAKAANGRRELVIVADQASNVME